MQRGGGLIVRERTALPCASLHGQVCQVCQGRYLAATRTAFAWCARFSWATERPEHGLTDTFSSTGSELNKSFALAHKASTSSSDTLTCTQHSVMERTARVSSTARAHVPRLATRWLLAECRNTAAAAQPVRARARALSRCACPRAGPAQANQPTVNFVGCPRRSLIASMILSTSSGRRLYVCNVSAVEEIRDVVDKRDGCGHSDAPLADESGLGVDIVASVSLAPRCPASVRGGFFQATMRARGGGGPPARRCAAARPRAFVQASYVVCTVWLFPAGRLPPARPLGLLGCESLRGPSPARPRMGLAGPQDALVRVGRERRTAWVPGTCAPAAARGVDCVCQAPSLRHPQRPCSFRATAGFQGCRLQPWTSRWCGHCST